LKGWANRARINIHIENSNIPIAAVIAVIKDVDGAMHFPIRNTTKTTREIIRIGKKIIRLSKASSHVYVAALE